MSLLSPFSPVSPGEGVGSEALTHQQVPFSPFISSLSSQLLLSLLHPCFAVFRCHSLFCFDFFFLTLLYRSSLPLTLCHLSLLYPCSLPFHCLFTSPLPIFHCLFIPSPYTDVIFISPSIPLPFHPPLFKTIHSFPTLHFTMSSSICFSLLITLCFPCFQRSTSSKVEEREEKRRGGGLKTRLPRARGTAYPYQASTCLLDPPGHTTLST